MNKTSITSIVAIVLALGALILFAIPKQQPTTSYGGVNGGTFGEGQASSTQVTLTGTSTAILAADPRRSHLSICNESSTAATFAFNASLAVNVGYVLAGNTCKSWDFPSVPLGKIYGIVPSAASGTVTVGILVGDGN